MGRRLILHRTAGLFTGALVGCGFAAAVCVSAQAPQAEGFSGPGPVSRVALAKDCLAQGAEAYKAGDYACASRMFEAVTRVLPDFAEPYKYLGYAEAALAFEKLPDLDKKKPKAWDPADSVAAKKALTALLAYHDRGGRDPRLTLYLDALFDSPILEDEAFKVLKERIKASPNDADDWRWMALLCDRTSQVPAAFEAGKNWLRLKPDSSEAFALMNRLFVWQCVVTDQPPKVITPILLDNIRIATRRAQAFLSASDALGAELEFRKALAWYLTDKRERTENAAAIERLTQEAALCPRPSAAETARKILEAGKDCKEILAIDPPTYLLGPWFDPGPIRCMGDVNVRPLQILRFVNPRYPGLEVSRGASGRVVLELVVGGDGSVRSARVLQSAGPLFDQEALQAAERVKYTRPCYVTESGEPRFVSTYWVFTINFTAR